MTEYRIEDPEKDFVLNLEVRIRGYGKRTHQLDLAQACKKLLEIGLHTSVDVLLVNPDNTKTIVMLMKQHFNDKILQVISPRLILIKVAQEYNVTDEDLLGPSRKKHIVNARHIACYCIRAMTDMSYPGIGDFFGKDHTTIMNAVQRVSDRIVVDPDFFQQITTLMKSIHEVERKN